MDEFRNRQRLLMEKLSTINAEMFVLLNVENSNMANIQYLTGFSGAGALCLSQEDIVLFTSGIYAEQAELQTENVRIEVTLGSYLDALIEALNKHKPKRIALGSRRMSHATFAELSAKVRAEIIPQEDPVAELRQIKQPCEIDAIREAITLTEAVLSECLADIRVGVTEREFALELEYGMRRRGADSIAFPPVVAFGEHCSIPHNFPSERRLRKGDLVLCDLGAKVNGYCADFTRTVVAGDAKRLMREIYDLVLRANQSARAIAKAGLACNSIDKTARDIIDAGGYKEAFGHGLGHSVGLEIHEDPRFSPSCPTLLQTGMVLTIEPGVYLPNVGGVRIEDMVLIGVDGVEVLTRFPEDGLMRVI